MLRRSFLRSITTGSYMWLLQQSAISTVTYSKQHTQHTQTLLGLKSDGMTGQMTGHQEVDTPRATVPSLSTCDRHTMGHWPVALLK